MNTPKEQRQFDMPSHEVERNHTILTGSSQQQEVSQNEPIHLVYSSDVENLPAVEASIRSVIQHASEPVVFHFIGDTPLNVSFPNLHYYNLTNVAAKYKLEEFTNLKERKEKGLVGLNSNTANFVRFVIADLLPDQHKAMWIDADTVVECDVVSMVRKALTKSSHAIAAVPVRRKPQGIQSKYVKHSISFNAGVFVVNLDRWRSQGLTRKIRRLTLKNRKDNIYAYGSQPPLVLTIGSKFEHLSPAWNVKVNKINHENSKGKACLLHWSGKRKPWNTFTDPNMHNEMWLRYASSTVNLTKDFQPDNVVLTSGIYCDSFKCFYGLKSDLQAGLLVAPSSMPDTRRVGTETNWYEALDKSWHYAEQLRKKYRITHLLLTPPTNMTISSGFASQLNLGRLDADNGTTGERYKDESTVILQKVARAPEPNFIIDAQRYNDEAFHEFLAPIKDKMSFARHLSQSLADTRQLIKNEPCLCNDFQLMMDKRGNVYHLSFERCFLFHGTRDETGRPCLQVLDQVEQLVNTAADGNYKAVG